MWTLKGVTSEQFDKIYAGTSAMEVKELFERDPDSDEDALANFFTSKLWRLNSGIYMIEDKEGNLIDFQMNWAQHVVYSELLRHPRLIILKSRQQGISTLWLIFALDLTITEDNTKAGLMSQGLHESKILKERLERAYDHLPSGLLEFLAVTNTVRNSSEFSLDNDSKTYIATSFRSGTLQMMHISEFGKISAKNPEKAKETRTGSMQAIKGGLPVILESTAEGRSNMFYEMWTQADTHTGNLAPKDFKTVFLSWVNDPDCRINVPQSLTRDAETYFDLLQVEYMNYFGEELHLDEEQKWWWVAQYREFSYNMDMMGQEYPGYPEEAFAATKDGTYWAKLYREHVVAKNQIVEDMYTPSLPVDVAIDLGMNDMMVIVFFQHSGSELRVIDEYHNSGEGILHYVNVMKAKPYRYRSVYLPHDAIVKELGTGKSRFSIFKKLGMPARILTRTKNVNNDIELVRKIIPHMWFDKKNTRYLQLGMENYAKEWDDRLGAFKDKPYHDEWSHPADAIRYMVVAMYHRIKPMGIAKVLPNKKKKSNVVDGMAL